jgi:hypothetical protein
MPRTSVTYNPTPFQSGPSFLRVSDHRAGLNSLKQSVTHSRHSLRRAAQRGVSDEVISLVIRYGRLVQKQGLKYYFGASRDFPAHVDHRLVEKANNQVVILRGANIITCYKNARGLKRIRKKREWLS